MISLYTKNICIWLGRGFVVWGFQRKFHVYTLTFPVRYNGTLNFIFPFVDGVRANVNQISFCFPWRIVCLLFSYFRWFLFNKKRDMKFGVISVNWTFSLFRFFLNIFPCNLNLWYFIINFEEVWSCSKSFVTFFY